VAIETGSKELRLGKGKYVLKDSMINIGLTDIWQMDKYFKWSISPYFLSYSITNLLGFIGLKLTFISGILGIKAYSIEIMKHL